MAETEYAEFREKIRQIFNKEKDMWGLWKLRTSDAQDVRSRNRI